MKTILEKYVEWASSFSQLWVIKSIRKGLMYNLPLFLIGSMVVLVYNLPIKEFKDFMDHIFGSHWREVLLYINDGTLQIISVCVVIGIAYAMFIDSKENIKRGLHSIIAISVILGCYLLFVKSGDEILPVKTAANTGLFSAIVFSVITTTLFIWLYKHRIFKLKLYTYNEDNMLSQALSVIEPALLTFSVVALFKHAVVITAVQRLDLDVLATFLESINELAATLIFEFLTQLLWFFGVHGSNILENVARDLFNARSGVNAALVFAGQPPTEILTKQFLDVFVYLGGAGSALCLILALLIKGNRNGTYKLAKFSVLPGLFNINELIIFGLPIVLNPFFLIPFIITPIALSASAYIAMFTGLVPLTINDKIHWTTPIILGGYVSVDSIRGSLLQIFNLGLGTAIYMPFVGWYENHKTKLNKKFLSSLIDEILNAKESCGVSFIDRMDDVGNVARTLAFDISHALETGENMFYMEFQPQVTYDNRLIGAEALLRWKHEFFGFIPPPVIIKIAEEAELTDKLGNWIIRNSFEQIADFGKKGITDVGYSLNLTYEQVRNHEIVGFIKNALEEFKLNPGDIEFELTEGAAFLQTPESRAVLNRIKKLGSRLAIDDFGMGHSTLLYIKDFHVDRVKLDRVLVEDILNDISSQEIVTSISNLCSTINLSLVAEFVETAEQKEKLNELGCSIYQGYLYSKSLQSDKFVEFANDFGI